VENWYEKHSITTPDISLRYFFYTHKNGKMYSNSISSSALAILYSAILAKSLNISYKN
jgi:hypothetical protein